MRHRAATILPRRAAAPADPPSPTATSLAPAASDGAMGLRSRFLAALPEPEHRRILGLAELVATALDHWAARFPLIRRVRVRPLSLAVVAAAPFDPLDALIATARVSLWVFALDDLFDEEGRSDGELVRRAREYRRITRGVARGGDDDLAVALTEVRDDLAGFPLFAILPEIWSGALIGTIDGMVREHYWRRHYRRSGDRALPTYATYLANGRYSIGGPPHIWSAVITTDDPTTANHLDALRPMEEIASRCVRLANDLRSAEKERAEGTINSLDLVARSLTGGDPSERARHQRAGRVIRGEIDRGLAELSALHAQARTRTGRPETAIARIAHFVCEFYSQHDFHTFGAHQ
jgi:hypothetical protein